MEYVIFLLATVCGYLLFMLVAYVMGRFIFVKDEELADVVARKKTADAAKRTVTSV